tara:strand:- start:2226 stop:4490 length:2265 start_codon:yes stop_codon:yes gene_type:complete
MSGTGPTDRSILGEILAELKAQREHGSGATSRDLDLGSPATRGRYLDVGTLEAATKAVEEQRAALANVDKEILKTQQSYIGLTESLEKDFQLALADATRGYEENKLAILENIEAQQKRIKTAEAVMAAEMEEHSVQTAKWNDAKVSIDLLNASIAQGKKKIRGLSEDLKDAGEQLSAEKGLTTELNRLGQSVLGLGVKSGGLVDKLSSLGKKFGEAKASGVNMGGAFKKVGKAMLLDLALKAVDVLVQSTFALIGAQDQAISSFRKATGAGKEYNLEITALERQTFIAGVTAADAGKAYTELYTSFSAFTSLSGQERNKLGKTTVLLEKLGVSVSTQGKIMDQMTRSLGMSADQTNATLLRLAGTAKSIGVPMGKLAQDFAGAFTELSKYGDNAIDVFEGLAQQSKKTGIEVGKLLGFAKQFDTFEGAAKSVGKLNAILGGPYLNSIDMLNASEEERIDLLRQTVDAAGIQFDAMNRFEKQAIASAMGMSVEDASRIMNMSTAEMELQALEQEQLAEQARETQTIMDQLKSALMGMAVDFRPFMETVVMPLVKILGDFGTWVGDAESGLGRFVKVGLTAAGIAALIAAPFTGGTSLLMLAAIAGIGAGAVAAAGAGTTSAGAVEAGATGNASLEGFAAGGRVFGSHRPKSFAPGGRVFESNAKTPGVPIQMNEFGEESAIVPVGTYVANAHDTRQMITATEENTKTGHETNRLLAEILASSGGTTTLQIDDGQQFSATVLKKGLSGDVVTPFAV